MSKEKQIEKITELLWHFPKAFCLNCYNDCEEVAKLLYDEAYRKQIAGAWTRFEVNGINYGQVYYQHKECKANETQLFPTPYNFCPNCGAHMRKEDEGK